MWIPQSWRNCLLRGAVHVISHQQESELLPRGMLLWAVPSGLSLLMSYLVNVRVKPFRDGETLDH